jgi:NAD(P)H-quinone oxidoreductase subunit 5
VNAPTWGPVALQWIAISSPVCLGLGVVFVVAAKPFRAATVATYLSLGLALVTAAGGLATPADRAGLAAATSLAGLVRLDAVTRVMLVLVAFIAVVIVRYSRSYLQGDAGQVRYARALLATLAAVTILVLANNLLVIALAWLGTSLALHQLLTFYRHRPQALVVAHKKFLVSRLADACMLGATVLIGTSAGSLDLDAVTAWAQANGPTPASMQLAAVLLVLAASLKSAQLPFHGWLVQVMEAPTPVSALLHAVVVNIGGFVMIRLAGFMAHAPLAQTLLVVIGMITAVVAALVMTTRVSIKVALAWSTCAQMGFMLVECGLGAWHLALLHLVAHSLYKAHAFLSSGTAVDAWRVRAISRPRPPASLARSLGVSALVLASVAACVAGGHALIAAEPSPTLVPLTIVLGLSVSPLIVRALEGGPRVLLGAVGFGAGAGVLYVAGHEVAGRLLPIAEPPSMPLTWIIVIVGFAVLFGVQLVLDARPGGRLARALQPRLFAGLYLDEVFTRMTFRLWPPRLRRPDVGEPARSVANPVEAPR